MFHPLFSAILAVLLVGHLVCVVDLYRKGNVIPSKKAVSAVFGLIFVGLVSRAVAHYRHGTETGGILVFILFLILISTGHHLGATEDDKMMGRRHCLVYTVTVACCFLVWFASWQF